MFLLLTPGSVQWGAVCSAAGEETFPSLREAEISGPDRTGLFSSEPFGHRAVRLPSGQSLVRMINILVGIIKILVGIIKSLIRMIKIIHLQESQSGE